MNNADARVVRQERARGLLLPSVRMTASLNDLIPQLVI